MDKEIVYKVIPKKKIHDQTIREIILSCFAVGFIATFIVNLCVGGKPFCLYVLFGEFLFYVTFLHRPLVEYSFIQKLLNIALAASLMLILIDFENNTSWSTNVVTIIRFSLMGILGLTFIVGFDKRKVNPMPILWLSLGSFTILLISYFAGVGPLDAKNIVMSLISIIIPIMGFLFYKDALIRELKKRFHTK